MTKTAQVVSNAELRAEVVRSELKQIRTDLEENYMKLARRLFEVHDNAYWDTYGYTSFKDFVEEDLRMKYRRARYLVVIASAVNRCGISWDRVISIGWTRMRHVAPQLTEKNAEGWLKKAEVHTSDQLAEMVKGVGRDVDASRVGTPKIHSVQLRMNEDQHSIIMDACDIAKRILGVESIVDALEHISYDWIQQSTDGPNKTPLDSVLLWVEKVYGVELIPKEGQDLESLLSDESPEVVDAPT